MMKGFTLVETLVAVTILAITIVGPMYAVQKALTASSTARDQLVASALAQEAVEYVRSIRDNNYLAGRTWLSNLGECIPGPCVIDPTQGGAPNDISTSVTPLYLSGNYLYNQQQSGTQTRFTRTVQIATVSPTEVRVTATVTWNFHGTQTVTITTTLQDWL